LTVKDVAKLTVKDDNRGQIVQKATRMKLTLERTLLIGLLVAYVLIASLFALLTPDWQIPDEPAHFNYARQLVEGRHCCPVIEPGDWDQAYLNRLTSERFHPDLLGNLRSIQYENHQPPLYYQIVSLVYGLGETVSARLILMRLVSVIFGAGVVYCAHVLSKTLWPDWPGVALGAAAFVGFLPQHIAMTAAVNNDSLTELLIGLTLLVLSRYLLGQVDRNQQLARALLTIALVGLPVLMSMRHLPTIMGTVYLVLMVIGVALWRRGPNADAWQLWLLGLLVGMIFVTKTTGYFLGGLVPLVIVLRARGRLAYPALNRANARAVGRQLAWFLIPAVVLGLMWWLRNIQVYGFPDFLGLGAHDVVVAEQMRTAEQIQNVGLVVYLQQSAQTTFHSFWGQFGWMALPLQGWMYLLFVILTLIVIAGWLISIFILRHRLTNTLPNRRLIWGTLLGTIALTALAYLYYNTEFLQLQGRYLYPALIPIGLLMALGVDAWRRWVLPQVVVAQWLPLAVFALLVPLDLYLLLWVIRPMLMP
jgi:hypothetical protein